MLGHLMTLSNNKCFEATNGLEVFAMVKRSLIARDATHNPGSQRLPDAFDVILMDNNMPQMSGIEATRELRKVGFNGPIIGISGDASDAEFLRAGADAVLVKPVSGLVLTKSIAVALKRQNLDILARRRRSDVLLTNVSSRLQQLERNKKTEDRGPVAPTVEQRGALTNEAAQHGSLLPSLRVGSRPSFKRVGREGSVESRGQGGGVVNMAVPQGLPLRIIPVGSRSRRLGRAGSVASMASRESKQSGSRNNSEWQILEQVMAVSPPPLGPPLGNPPCTSQSRAGSVRIHPNASVRHLMSSRASTAFVTDEAVRLRWEDVMSYTLNFILPEFHTAEMRWAYAEYSRSNLNYKLGVMLIGPAFLSLLLTRGSIATLWHLNPAFVLAFVSYVVVVVCCVMLLFNRFAAISHRYKITFMQPYYEAATKFYQSPFHDIFDNAVVIFNALCTSLYVLARVLQGGCPPGTTMWNEQDCNPEGDAGEVPQDSLLIAIVSLIAIQIFIGCAASRHSVVAAWTILVVLMNISMSIVGSHLYYWNNAVLLIAICMSYEIVR